MPGGAGRQPVALEHEHVGPAGVGEVVGDRGADDAAADDDDSGTGRKLDSHPHNLVADGARDALAAATDARWEMP